MVMMEVIVATAIVPEITAAAAANNNDSFMDLYASSSSGNPFVNNTIYFWKCFCICGKHE